ncbi:MAG: nucleotidyltransferase domain-containing protein [Verrucomicrobiales bacterium]|nr:nucleotidyltransferase domain-containing protein [Verrucomicrobiales bacterium]
MNDRICERLKEIETEYGFQILYACESGSRAWGFASEDSDYDVRFIYCWSPESYLGIYPPRDQLDLGVDAENLDFSGWDLHKSLPLFRKSNGSLMEWLHSPIVYFEDQSFMREWRQLAQDYFVPKATTVHYLGLCRKMWLSSCEQDKITAKKYLYILRSLLSARYITENRSPVPVKFSETMEATDLSPEVVEAIRSMIETKATQQEADLIPRVPVLDQYIEAERSRLGAIVETLSADQGPVERLDEFFRSAIGFES